MTHILQGLQPFITVCISVSLKNVVIKRINVGQANSLA